MAPVSSVNPLHKPNSGTALIQAVLDTVREIAGLLRTETDDGELRVFYATLMAYCFIIRDHLDRIAKSGLSLACNLDDSITARLAALLTSQTSKEPFEVGLRAIHAQWNEVRTKDNLIKAQFIRSSVDFGEQHDQRMDLVDFLVSWESDVRARYPEDQSLWTAEDLAPQKQIGDPSLAVWNAAQAAFKAMSACQRCGCMPAHDFGARVYLGTHRKPQADAAAETEGEVSFDMFLSAMQDWQEVRVRTVKEKAIRFVVEGQASPTPAITQPKPRAAARVRHLCEPLFKAKEKKMKAYRLELKVMRGQLFKLQSERSNRLADLTKSPISLEEFLQSGPQAFSDKTKRILAVLLSCAVLHLYDTPWLPPTWSSSDILFFRTNAFETPLRPFLQTRLSGMEADGSKLDGQARQPADWDGDDEFDPDDMDPDDLLQHPCPSLVTLAITLMEVRSGMPFVELARRLNVEVEGDASCFTRYLDASMVFEAYRNKIPENLQFLSAVDKCLDPAAWQDEDGGRLDSPALRSKVYEEIVRPLETDLSLAYSFLSIEDLDEFAQTLDMSGWDQVLRGEHAQGPESHQGAPGPRSGRATPLAPISIGNASPSHGQHPSLIPVAPIAHHHLGVYQDNYQLPPTPVASPRPVPKRSGEEGYMASRFFDDETPPTGHSVEA